MEEPIMAGSYLYLDNVEILLKDHKGYVSPRILKKKVHRTCDRISAMMLDGIDFEEVIDQSVELITTELRPSRFGYVCSIIASEFPDTFLKWVKTRALAGQVLAILKACEPVFDLIKFNAKAKGHHSIYVTLTNFIRHYLKTQKKKPVLKAKKAPAAIIEPMPALETITSISAVQGEPNLFLPATGLRSLHTQKRHYQQAIDPLEIMASKQYPVNKGINKSIIFKGLKAQYIGYMGLGLLIDLLFYAVLYMLKVNTYINLFLTAALGALITIVVYHLNAQYGEHGLSKMLAKRKIPKLIRSFSRKIFKQ